MEKERGGTDVKRQTEIEAGRDGGEGAVNWGVAYDAQVTAINARMKMSAKTTAVTLTHTTPT